jgi:aminopeptidase N
VAWRTYRDQWLSEGFAEYSGILYTGQRDSAKSRKDFIDDAHRILKMPPVGITKGVQSGRLADLGPIVLGHRLATRETLNAYTGLIYSKGALVLRMLHFLLSDPATGNDTAFRETMADFVKRYLGSAATTEDFIRVANEHFAQTALARKYNLKDLEWFFRQWVYEAHLPSYNVEYQVENQSDGSVVVKGTVYQEGVPEEEKWFMPIPIVMHFGKDKVARGTIAALGPQAPFSIKLPARPEKIEVDPELFILSDKTRSKEIH